MKNGKKNKQNRYLIIMFAIVLIIEIYTTLKFRGINGVFEIFFGISLGALILFILWFLFGRLKGE